MESLVTQRLVDSSCRQGLLSLIILFLSNKHENIFKEIGFWTFSIVQIFNRLNTRRFGDWICLRPQVKGKEEKEGNPVLLGPLEKANINPLQSPKHRVFSLLKIRTMEKSPEAYFFYSTTIVKTFQNLSKYFP
jgi:hypothetical protein